MASYASQVIAFLLAEVQARVVAHVWNGGSHPPLEPLPLYPHGDNASSGAKEEGEETKEVSKSDGASILTQDDEITPNRCTCLVLNVNLITINNSCLGVARAVALPTPTAGITW
jgi:hypothetical protein